MTLSQMLALFLACTALGANPSAQSPGWAKQAAGEPVPTEARLSLHFDRPEFHLGENVLAHLVVENAGASTFELDQGGDYRGATRRLRFQVTATDETGRALADPDESGVCFGGFMSKLKVEPGKSLTFSMPIHPYRRFETPGRYTVRATHDFGWRATPERPHPVAEAQVALRMPTAQEAEAIVAQMETMKDPGMSVGQKSPGYPDFACLKYPIYLPALILRAERGQLEVFKGLAHIETVEATRELLRLAEHADAKVAEKAIEALLMRLPLPRPLAPEHAASGWMWWQKERQRRASTCWSADDLGAATRGLAARLLAREETELIAAGAQILEAVGTVEDGREIKTALARALQPWPKPRRQPADNVLDLPPPFRTLQLAAAALRERGFRVGPQLSGDAEILLYFWQLADPNVPRETEWEQTLDAFFITNRWPLREAAVRALPEPVPAKWKEKLLAALQDEDLAVQRAACEAAGKSGDSHFRRTLIELVATENHPWVLRAAGEAARKLGAGVDLLAAWAERLGDAEIFPIALDYLQTVSAATISGSSGRTDLSRAERLAVREAWRTFLVAHANALAAGKRFEVGDAALKPELFGRARSIRFRDGRTWPSELN